jgi:lipid II:glycine glycyltransferase (peptidoglycan interpeptide bridge formation enzyme)
MSKLTSEQWHSVLEHFRDANIYQTWAWGAHRVKERCLDHVILEQNNRPVVAGQCWVVEVPGVGGVCHLKWGPLWHSSDGIASRDCLRHFFQVLKEQYVVEKGLLLRVVPIQFGADYDVLHSVLLEEGFEEKQGVNPYRTMVLDLHRSIEEITALMSKHWRRNLRRSANNDLQLALGRDDALFPVVCQLYDEMIERKKFKVVPTADEVRAINQDLPDRCKVVSVTAEHQGLPVAAGVASAMGDNAMALILATGDRGLELDASYALLWRLVCWAKDQGCQWFDLNGYDPVNFAGTSQFKHGLAGKQGQDVSFVEYECCTRSTNRVVVAAAERARNMYRGFKCQVSRIT